MSREWYSVASGGIRLTIHVMPNAKKSEVVGIYDGALKIRLQAEPIEGKANDALLRYLAALLDIPKSAVEILHGHTGKRKIIEIDTDSLDVDGIRRVLFPGGE